MKSAWIKTEAEIFSVSLTDDAKCSAVVELIERIYHAESLRPVSRARTILRERIFSSTEPTMVERETVKVTAKRVAIAQVPDAAPNLPEAPLLPAFELPDFPLGTVLPPSEIPVALARLKLKTTQARDRWTSDRPVSAILVDRDNRILATAWNTNAVIRTRHAEANLCTTLRDAGKSIPADSALYVSLKPCRMCAARIWEMAEDPARLRVIYLENDPGPFAQGTMLDADSPARLRYLGPKHPLLSAKISSLGLEF